MCAGTDILPEKHYFDSSLGKISAARGNFFYQMRDLTLNNEGIKDYQGDELTKHDLANLLFEGGCFGQLNRERFLANGLLTVTWVIYKKGCNQ